MTKKPHPATKKKPRKPAAKTTKKSKTKLGNINLARLSPAERYAHDVVSGSIVAGKYIRLACKRYFHDIKTAKSRNLYFDRKEAQHAIDWIQAFCRHFKGEWAGTLIKLEPWQQFIYWNVFGWRWKDTRRTRFRLAFIQVAKKNGKTTGILAPILLYKTFAEGEPGAEGYFAGSAHEQSMIAFKDSRSMVLQDEWLKEEFNVFKMSITDDVSSSILRAIPAKHETWEGKNPHANGVDEYWTARTSEMFDILYRGMSTRRNPLTTVVTTAGYNTEGPCYRMRSAMVDVLEGRVEDDTAFPLIYELDEEDHDNWKDERLWPKANPSLGITKRLFDMRREMQSSITRGEVDIASFKTKELNMWLNSKITWISDDHIKRAMQIGVKEKYHPNLAGIPVSLGLDVASVEDVTALGQIWDLGDGRYWGKVTMWMPEETYERYKGKSEKHPFVQYVRTGHIRLTKGNVTDLRAIRRYITGHHEGENGEQTYDNTCLAASWSIKGMSYDKWNATDIAATIGSDGVATNEHRQGFVSMNFPTKALAKGIISNPTNIYLEENLALRWMFKNVAIVTDEAGNIKVSKKKSEAKVDGVVALIMALSESMSSPMNTLIIPENFTIPEI